MGTKAMLTTCAAWTLLAASGGAAGGYMIAVFVTVAREELEWTDDEECCEKCGRFVCISSPPRGN